METTEEQREKLAGYFATFIRYGYNQALIDVEKYFVSIMDSCDIDTLTKIQDRVHEMMSEKREVDKDTLKIEISKGELIDAYRDYIIVLLDEINSLIGIASVHGWRSQNVELGKKCREKIKELGGELVTPTEQTK